MTNQLDHAEVIPANQAGASYVPRMSQFRLYTDCNKLIPIHKMTKTAFVHEAVKAAANNPNLLGLALAGRATRMPNEDVARISIASQSDFDVNVKALATTFRMTNEEIVRLAVEAAVYVANDAMIRVQA